jgi:SAM-dependent methyltransferase
MAFDPASVRAFEHAGWQRVAAGYDATFARATAQFATVLLDAAGVTEGSEVLDLCCGTGLVTAAAAARGAVPTGLDFSAAMLAEARRAHPDLRFDEGEADALPYPDRSFDAVVANLGVHHVAQPEQAEALRVLRPGGRLTFTGWAVPDDNVAWRLLFDAIRALGDLAATQTPPSGAISEPPRRCCAFCRMPGSPYAAPPRSIANGWLTSRATSSSAWRAVRCAPPR